jgi:hypothetical protein
VSKIVAQEFKVLEILTKQKKRISDSPFCEGPKAADFFWHQEREVDSNFFQGIYFR